MSKPQVQHDPIAWIERLREVNEGSAFTAQQREFIEDRLSKLQQELTRLAPLDDVGARK